MFAAGGGAYDKYDRCSWQVKGTGQFRPREGAHPYLGSQGTVETVDEYRVEMICTNSHVRGVVAALVSAHPYEEPAYAVVKILTAADL